MLGLMTTCFLVLSTGRIWSSIAANASEIFLRRLAPFETATTDRGAAWLPAWGTAEGGCWARNRKVEAANAAVVQRKSRRDD